MVGFGDDRKSRKSVNTFLQNNGGDEMFRNALIAVLCLGVAGLGYWGYTQQRDKNALMIQNENHYQQSFHELAYYVDKIHDNLGTSLATDQTSNSLPQLAEVWRLSNQARDDIGKLPLGLMSFSDTSSFLSKLGNFTYATAVKNPTQSGLNNQNYKQLEALYTESSKVEKDLRNVQDTIVTKHLKWTDVQAALQSKNPRDNQIVDGLETVNQKVANFDKNWQPTVNNPMEDLKKLNAVRGTSINKGDAISKVKNFIGITSNNKVDVQKIGNGAGYNAFNLMFNNPGKDDSITAAVTQKGGHIIWFMKQRSIASQDLSLNQAVKKAAVYLNQKGFKGYEEVLSDQYDNIGVISFAKKINHVLVYPDSIKVKVALDNGEILGFDQTEHLITEISKIPSLKPKLTAKEAQKGMRGSMKVEKTKLVIYKNDQSKDVLCYEFLTTKGKDTYRIMVNANSGLQENVNLLTV